MAGCQSGLFEYEFVYIEWTATSLGAVVGGFGGLFLGVVLLGVAVFVHQLKLARMQSETSLKDQVCQAVCISDSGWWGLNCFHSMPRNTNICDIFIADVKLYMPLYCACRKAYVTTICTSCT